ncbi:MAG: rRNA maturation RNase YbeY [Planctomycetales bacterium]
MYTIEIANQQRVLRVDRTRLIRLAEATLKAERVKSATISVALVDDARIHELNRKFLGHDYATDVISFLLEAQSPAHAGRLRRRQPPTGLEFRGAGKALEGEVVISAETAVQIAAEYHWRPTQELSLYLVHGLLHLCGYNDETSGEQHQMRTREMEILAPWKIVPHYVA